MHYANSIKPLEALWTAQEVAEAVSPINIDPPYKIYGKITGISIDTRTLQEGDLFIALPGEHTDGGNYIYEAFEKGAAAAMSERAFKSHKPYFQVSNIQEAFERLAKRARARAYKTRYIGITGSVGKTTSRSTLSHILRHFEKEVFETPKNFNNHWGTPYSLCQMPPNTKYGVFEMGMNHKGEIDSLSALVRPDISLITTVGIAHKANFETVEDIARAKAEIFNHTEKGGIAIINRDIACHPLLEKAAKQNRLQVINFGIHHNADIRLLGYRTHAQGSDFKISVMNHIFEGHVTFPGKHFLFNVLGLIGVTHSLGLDTNRVLKALSQMKPLPGRGAQYTLNWRNNTLHVIDESYNANPLSMEAALNVLGAMQPAPPGRRVVILGDMGELGKETLRAHQDLCTPLMRHKIDCVMTCGPYMRKMKNILPPNMQGPSFDDAEALIRSGLSDLIHNDIVLIKGSNASGLERVVAHLRKS